MTCIDGSAFLGVVDNFVKHNAEQIQLTWSKQKDKATSIIWIDELPAASRSSSTVVSGSGSDDASDYKHAAATSRRSVFHIGVKDLHTVDIQLPGSAAVRAKNIREGWICIVFYFQVGLCFPTALKM